MGREPFFPKGVRVRSALVPALYGTVVWSERDHWSVEVEWDDGVTCLVMASHDVVMASEEGK